MIIDVKNVSKYKLIALLLRVAYFIPIYHPRPKTNNEIGQIVQCCTINSNHSFCHKM